jgi:hypothetical protein
VAVRINGHFSNCHNDGSKWLSYQYLCFNLFNLKLSLNTITCPHLVSVVSMLLVDNYLSLRTTSMLSYQNESLHTWCEVDRAVANNFSRASIMTSAPHFVEPKLQLDLL